MSRSKISAVLWTAFVLFMAVGVYYTPPPAPGESITHYLLAEEQTWQSFTACLAASLILVVLVMRNLLRGPSSREGE